jgi:hypothetical protein
VSAPPAVRIVTGNQTAEDAMPAPAKKTRVPYHAFLVLFTIFGIPILIALPFLLAGFIGRM